MGRSAARRLGYECRYVAPTMPTMVDRFTGQPTEPAQDFRQCQPDNRRAISYDICRTPALSRPKACPDYLPPATARIAAGSGSGAVS